MRFHVVAADDSPEAQIFKYRLCGAVGERVRALFEGCADGNRAWERALENIGLIEKWAREAARQLGYGGDIRAEAGLFEFDERKCGNITVPAGTYRAVRIVIGGGEGRNWWCLLYPEICMPEDYVPGMQVEFYSSVLKWIKCLLGGCANG